MRFRLLWADPPPSVLHRLYQQARRATPTRLVDCYASDPALRLQPWLRAVQREFHRLLRDAGIYVEGLS